MTSILESMPDYQSHEQCASKNSMAKADKARPHIRACESCRTRKIRCIPQDKSKDGKCQRCAKSARDCIFTSPEKRKRRKRTDARVADLENMVQMLAARLEQEQRARIESNGPPRPQPSHNQEAVTLDRSPSQPSDISSHSPIMHEASQSDSVIATGSMLPSDLRQPPPPQSPTVAAPASGLSSNPSSRRSTSSTLPTAVRSPLPRMAAPSPSLIIQEPLPSPLPHTQIPDILTQQYAPWPTSTASINLDPLQATATDTLYSPCPSHSSTLTHSDTCSSDASQYTMLDLATADEQNLFDIPITLGTDFHSMDAAISAQLNLPCQNQGIWWPQSNITCPDLPAAGEAAAAAAAPARHWIPSREGELFSWQSMQWA
ncbi:MAG: hypothetical protein Q9182_004205 [Xanthomendoza sp. 2 TL-2023]